MKYSLLLLLFMPQQISFSQIIMDRPLFDLPCNPFVKPEVIALSDQTFNTNTRICAKRSILKSGGKVTLKKNCIIFQIDAEILDVEVRFIIDGEEPLDMTAVDNLQILTKVVLVLN